MPLRFLGTRQSRSNACRLQVVGIRVQSPMIYDMAEAVHALGVKIALFLFEAKMVFAKLLGDVLQMLLVIL
jgi:hypothetical protein